MKAAGDVPTWRGDEVFLVWGIRHVLRSSSPNPHAAVTVLDTLRANVEQLGAGVKQTIVKDISDWLDGPAGQDASRFQREQWVLALAALGVRRRYRAPEASR